MLNVRNFFGEVKSAAYAFTCMLIPQKKIWGIYIHVKSISGAFFSTCSPKSFQRTASLAVRFLRPRESGRSRMEATSDVVRVRAGWHHRGGDEGGYPYGGGCAIGG